MYPAFCARRSGGAHRQRFRADPDPERAGAAVIDNLGVAAVPGVPWIGGSDLVVWRDAQMYPDKERAALVLVKYLTSLPVQIKYAIASQYTPGAD